MKKIISFALSFLFVFLLVAQAAPNPFELHYRADSLYDQGSDPGNPFELQVRPISQAKKSAEHSPSLLLKRQLPARPEMERAQINLSTTLLVLVLLTIYFTLYRSQITKAFFAFFNENQMFQFYREQEGRGAVAVWTLFVLFPINLGIFLFFALDYFGIYFYTTLWAQLGTALAIATFALLIKFVVLYFIASLFSLQKDINRYIFLILVFGIVLGIIVAPVNILLAYAPQGRNMLVTSTLGLIALAYLFRALRGLLSANKIILTNTFHFLLYICAVEALPLLLFYKAIKG